MQCAGVWLLHADTQVAVVCVFPEPMLDQAMQLVSAELDGAPGIQDKQPCTADAWEHELHIAIGDNHRASGRGASVHGLFALDFRWVRAFHLNEQAGPRQVKVRQISAMPGFHQARLVQPVDIQGVHHVGPARFGVGAHEVAATREDCLTHQKLPPGLKSLSIERDDRRAGCAEACCCSRDPA
ncbi:hypothetical protein D3C76_740590 [compost metagenome]